MLTSTKIVISALLLACSASGALAQGLIGDGPYELMRPVKPYYGLPRHNVVLPRYFGGQAYGNELRAAPYGGR
jgi:hypothetical protein